MKNLIILVLLFASLPAIAEIVYNQPERTIEEVSDGIIVTYSFNNPEIVESEYYENTKYIRYDGFGLNDNDGEPCIPFRNDTYLVPNDCAVKISVLDSAYNDTTFVMSPSMPLMPDDGSPVLKHSIKPYTGFFPLKAIQSRGVFQHREDALISVCISPLKYNYQTNTVRIYSLIKYKLTYAGMVRDYKGNNTSLARKICLNLPCNRNNTDITIRDDKHYLIITTTEYQDSLNLFVRWKRLKGYNMCVASRPKGSWTVSSVTDTIQYHFDTDSIDYLLIVGDVDDVPPADTVYYNAKEAITDYQYGIIDNNNIPQVARGRIPVNNTTELMTILNKIVKYEQTPINDVNFYNTALHLSRFQDGDQDVQTPRPKDGYEDVAFTLCVENIRNYLVTNYEKNVVRGYVHGMDVVPTHWNSSTYSDGDSIPFDLRPGIYDWSFNYINIKSVIENGVFYVLYRGHGQEGIWTSPGFPIDIPPIHQSLPLANSNKFPFIFSITCLTGKYNYGGGDCLAEKFLKNQNQSGGCVGIIAATQESYSGYNDAMTFGIFDAIWPGFIPIYRLNSYGTSTYNSPTYEVGKIMDLGLIRMSETWGFPSFRHPCAEYTWKLYHCFGDPSMMLYTDKPQYFNNPSIKLNNDTLYVNVFDGDCRINIVNNVTNEVQSYYGDAVALYVGNDDITICLDKHNFVPYVWKKDIYIQNEDIVSTKREYHAQSVKIGNHVTDQKPQGNVIVTNSNVTIKADKVTLDKGTTINIGSSLIIRALQ